VQFQRDGVEYLLDAVTKDRASMIRPLAEVRANYMPWFGVGPHLERYHYYGFACFLLGLSP
jgi:hypothetical protein